MTLLRDLPTAWTDDELIALPRLNIDLLTQVLERIESDPEHWDQQYWFRANECGTTYCFAGWACVLDGKIAEGAVGNDPHSFGWYDEGKASLGLTKLEANALFLRTLAGWSLAPTDGPWQEKRKQLELQNIKTVIEYLLFRHSKQEEAFARRATAIEAAEREASTVDAPSQRRERV